MSHRQQRAHPSHRPGRRAALRTAKALGGLIFTPSLFASVLTVLQLGVHVAGWPRLAAFETTPVWVWWAGAAGASLLAVAGGLGAFRVLRLWGHHRTDLRFTLNGVRVVDGAAATADSATARGTDALRTAHSAISAPYGVAFAAMVVYFVSQFTGSEVLHAIAFIGAAMSVGEVIPLGNLPGKAIAGVWWPRGTGSLTPSRGARIELACWHLVTGAGAAVFAYLAASDLLHR